MLLRRFAPEFDPRRAALVTHIRPAVGDRYSARNDHDLRLMVSERAVISVPRGTILEITSLDERWDHAHASIASFCQIMASLEVLDGPSAGETIAVHISGCDRHLGTPESDDWDLPNWLVAVARA